MTDNPWPTDTAEWRRYEDQMALRQRAATSQTTIKRGNMLQAAESRFSVHEKGLLIRYPDDEPCALLAWDEVTELVEWLNKMLGERAHAE